MAIQGPGNLYSASKYIVSSDSSTPYSTLPSAIDAAKDAGIDATIHVRAGTYTGNFTIYDGITLVGSSKEDCVIVGTITPPATGYIGFKDLTLQSLNAHIISSAAAGTTAIQFTNVQFYVDGTGNPYKILDLANWTGAAIALLDFSNCLDTSDTGDSVAFGINDATVLLFNSQLGSQGRTSTSNGFIDMISSTFENNLTMASGGSVRISHCDVDGGFHLTAADIEVTNSFLTPDAAFNGGINVTFNASCHGNFTLSRIGGGTSAAMTTGESDSVLVDGCYIESTAVPALAGSGSYSCGTNFFPNMTAINTSRPTKALEVNSSTGDGLRLIYNDNNGSPTKYVDFAVSSAGGLTTTTKDDLSFIVGGNKVSFKNLVDSVTGFQVLDSSEDCILNIDTTNKYIGIKDSSPANPLSIDPSALGTTNTIGGKDFSIGAMLKITSSRAAYAAYVGNDYLNGAGEHAHYLSLFPYDDSADSSDKSWKAFRLMTGLTLVDRFWVNKYGSGYFEGVTGFNTTAPGKQVEINHATGECLRLTYNDANGAATYYSDFSVSSTGDLTITPSSGNRLMPTQPSFFAHNDTLRTNVTGDGTQYTMQFEVERWDQNSDYNATHGIFTAPVAGKYHFVTTIYMDDVAVNHTNGFIIFDVSNFDTNVVVADFASMRNKSNDVLSLTNSFIVDMDAGDTARVKLVASGGAKVIDIPIEAGGATANFSGYLVH